MYAETAKPEIIKLLFQTFILVKTIKIKGKKIENSLIYLLMHFEGYKFVIQLIYNYRFGVILK